MDGLGILSAIALFAGYPLAPAPSHPVSEWGLDRLSPLHADRQIHTTNLQWLALGKDLPDWRTELRLGVTLSRATGEIEQLEGRLEDGTLRAVRYDSPAWGIGPLAEGRFTAWQHEGLRLNLHLSAALLVYDRRFPAGGDHYNGMIQAGPSLDWSLGTHGKASIGWRWVHVSNGQGLVPRNPSYEAQGLSVRWTRAL